jgi:hypothetical protein
MGDQEDPLIFSAFAKSALGGTTRAQESDRHYRFLHEVFVLFFILGEIGNGFDDCPPKQFQRGDAAAGAAGTHMGHGVLARCLLPKALRARRPPSRANARNQTKVRPCFTRVRASTSVQGPLALTRICVQRRIPGHAHTTTRNLRRYW